ncbi:MAG TPA: metallophosphoesterase family protein [Terriglobales bacterium]|nr:metallophosphoesterase family protein [Terriglobales bacterium]
MRLLLIADIHSNLEGFEAAMAAAPAHDAIVNLGDVVGYGAAPNEVTDRCRALKCLTVRGNHDKACSGVTGVESFNPVAGLAALWTKQVLTPENLEWLKQLPQGPLKLDSLADAQFVHGSPLDEDEYVIVIRDAVEPLLRTQLPLTFFGHTHIQGAFSLEADVVETIRPSYRLGSEKESYQIPLRKTARYMINPGSVGQPRDGDPRAAFALFDTSDYSITFHRVPYNIAGAQKRIQTAKLPERLATRLADGR